MPPNSGSSRSQQLRRQQRVADELGIDPSQVATRDTLDRGITERLTSEGVDAAEQAARSRVASSADFVQSEDVAADVGRRSLSVDASVAEDRRDDVAQRASESVASDSKFVKEGDVEADVDAGGVSELSIPESRRSSVAERVRKKLLSDLPNPAKASDLNIAVGAQGVKEAGVKEGQQGDIAARVIDNQFESVDVDADDVKKTGDGFQPEESVLKRAAADAADGVADPNKDDLFNFVTENLQIDDKKARGLVFGSGSGGDSGSGNSGGDDSFNPFPGDNDPGIGVPTPVPNPPDDVDGGGSPRNQQSLREFLESKLDPEKETVRVPVGDGSDSDNSGGDGSDSPFPGDNDPGIGVPTPVPNPPDEDTPSERRQGSDERVEKPRRGDDEPPLPAGSERERGSREDRVEQRNPKQGGGDETTNERNAITRVIERDVQDKETLRQALELQETVSEGGVINASEFGFDADRSVEASDFEVTTTESGQQVQLETDARRERAAFSLDAQYNDVNITESDITQQSNGLGLRDPAQREIAADRIEGQTGLSSVDPFQDLSQQGDGFGLAGSARREFAAQQIEQETALSSVDPNTGLADTGGGLGLATAPRRRLAAQRFESQTDLSSVDPQSDIIITDSGAAELTRGSEKRLAAGKLDQQVSADITVDDVERVTTPSGDTQFTFDEEVNF